MDEAEARVIGALEGVTPGPTLLVIGGLHGNEPSGVRAAGDVLTAVERRGLELRGRLVAARGNLAALQRGERYLDTDLNRGWNGDAPEEGDAEAAERQALLALLEAEECRRRGPLILLDLHSTSAGGAPFCVVGDTLRNRKLAFRLPLPVILGLEEAIDGSLIEYVTERGHVAMAVEGGRHEDLGTVSLHGAVIWLVAAAAGCLAVRDVPDHERSRSMVARTARGLPRVVEILHRRGIPAGGRFELVRDLESFDPVTRGELLGRLDGQDLRAELSGLVLLPLKQKVGADAWFIGRPVGRLQQALAFLFRILGLHLLVPLLPGVRRSREQPGAFIVDPRIARFLVRPVFNLLGYRWCRPLDGKLQFKRRRPSP